MALLLTACNAGGRPEPDMTQDAMTTPEMAPATPAAVMPPEPLPGSIDYYVATGDTLESVSARFGVAMQSLVDANALQPPFALTEGQRLSIPPRREHTVVKGDTIYNISNRYGVEQADLTRVNGIASDNKIRLGQVLTIPEPPGSVVVAAAPAMTATDATMMEPIPDATAPAGPPIVLEPAEPATTASGVTAVELAPLPAVTPSPPPAAATAAAPATDTASLVVPDVRPPTPEPVVQPAPPPAPTQPEPEVAAVTAEPLSDQPPAAEPAEVEVPVEPAVTPPEPEVAVVTPVVPPEPEPTTPPVEEAVTALVEPSVSATEPGVETLSAAVPEPPALSGDRFLWPVQAGKIVLGYGPTTSGQHNDGVNIAAPAGTEVRAAENGVVAYAGNELRGFGNLLLVRHADGWMTAYAHNDALLVKRGDVVERGQPIAKVGQSGSVGEPQLHFELRRGTRALDPLPYLGEEGTE